MNASKDCLFVFEDEFFNNFYPISSSRPVSHILAGAKTNLERIKHHFSEFSIFTLCRPQLSNIFNGLNKQSFEELKNANFEKVLLINGNAVFRYTDSRFINELKKSDDFIAYINDEILIAAILPMKAFWELNEDILCLYYDGKQKKIIEESKQTYHVDILSFSNIWEPLLNNPMLIESDFNEYYNIKGSHKYFADSYVYKRSKIFFGDNVCAEAASVLDAREGPIIIEKDVEVKPFTYIKGPAFIGNGCKLVGGKITGGCSIGSGCKIGGEIENTIIIANSNKSHEGFIGHAYIGEWVNLGALTTNSNLANNYSEISVKQNGIITKTGNIKIGCFIGDHTKTGIGITLNTGAVIGFSCNLFGGTLILEKEVPSFAWGNDFIRRTVNLKKAMQTAEIVLTRRNYKLKENHRNLFEHIYIESEELRKNWAAKNSKYIRK